MHQNLSSEAIQTLVNHLPDHVKIGLLEKAAELDCPIEAAIEMAIASFLDDEAFSFEDCLLNRRIEN